MSTEMVFQNLLGELAASHKPTRQDLERARQDLQERPEYHATSRKPNVFDMQVRCLAMGYVAARNQEAKSVAPALTPHQKHGLFLQRCRNVTQAMMGAGTMYAGITFDDPGIVESSVIRFLRTTPANHLLLLGGTGCGKTRGAVCWVGERAQFIAPAENCMEFIQGKRNLNAKFVDAYEVWLHLHHKDKAFLHELETIKYLIIDDLGTESNGFRAQDLTAYFEHLYSLRHRNQLPTVMTCNATSEDFGKLYGARFISRFNEHGELHESADGDFREPAQ